MIRKQSFLFTILVLLIAGCAGSKPIAYVEKPIVERAVLQQASIPNLSVNELEKLKKQIEEKWTVRIGDHHITWNTLEVQKAELDYEAKLKMYTQEEYREKLRTILEECSNFLSFSGILEGVNSTEAELLETSSDNIFLISDSGTKLYPKTVICDSLSAVIGTTIYHYAAIIISFPESSQIINESTRFIKLVIITGNKRLLFEWNFSGAPKD